MPRLVFNDLGGGINQGQSPATIRDNEAFATRNFYPFGTKLRRRGGMRCLNTGGPYAQSITGIFPYRPEGAAEVTTVFGATSTIAKLDGTDIVAINPAVDFTLGSSDKPWTMFEYKDILYLIRESSNELVRCDGTYYGGTGITPPASAPTLAAGAAGDIPAADFLGVYTFYNPDTGVESNPSPASAVYTHAGSAKINWSGIGTSTNTQVAARRLYRTLPNQTGEYYFVAQIDDNFTTTFTGDNVLVQDLGEAVSFSNGMPPTNLHFGAVWKERLFTSDKVDVFYSESGRVENFDEDSVISVFPDDGHEIRAIHAYGDRLVIGKTNKVHYLVGTDPDNFALLTLSDRHGCAAHHTMQSAEGLLFWVGLDNIYRSDGNSVTGIASVKLKTYLQSLQQNVELLENASAAVYPALNWYVVTFPGESVSLPVPNFDWFSDESSTEVHLDASGSEGDITSFAWDFGDGNTGTGATIIHNYVGADPDATFTVTLTVTGPDGSTSVETVVTVNASPGNDGTAEGDGTAVSYPDAFTLIYNYKTDAWVEGTPNAEVGLIAEHFDTDYKHELFAADLSGNVYRYNDTSYNYDDVATVPGSISCHYKSKDLDFGNPGAIAVVERLFLLTPQPYTEEITMRWARFTDTINERTVSLNFPEQWKTYALATRQGAKAQTHLELEYTGVTAIEIEGWAVDGNNILRFSSRPH